MGRPASHKHPPKRQRQAKRHLGLSREGRSGQQMAGQGASNPKDGRPCNSHMVASTDAGSSGVKLSTSSAGADHTMSMEGHADRPGQPVETHRAFNEERVPSVPSYRRYRPNRTLLLATGRNIVLGELHDHRLYGLPSGRMVIVHTIMEMEICHAKVLSS